MAALSRRRGMLRVPCLYINGVMAGVLGVLVVAPMVHQHACEHALCCAAFRVRARSTALPSRYVPSAAPAEVYRCNSRPFSRVKFPYC